MKKTNKQITVLAQTMLCIAAIITLALTLATCKDDNPPPPAPCNCATTYGRLDHLGIDEQCTCSATVHPCGCTEQKDILSGLNVEIRKEAGIDVDDFVTAVGIINEAYEIDSSNLDGKVTAIHITKTGKVWRYDSNKVIWMHIDEVKLGKDNFANFLDAIRSDIFTPGAESDDDA